MISSLVVGSSRWASLGVSVSLNSEASAGFASGGKTSHFSVLVLRSSDPVDSCVISDGVVSAVNHDNLIVFIDTVLGNPITVEDSKTTEGSSSSFFGF